MHCNRSGFRAGVINRHARIIQITQAAKHVRVSRPATLPQHNLLAHLKARIKARMDACRCCRLTGMGVCQRRLGSHLCGVAIAPVTAHSLESKSYL